MKVHWVRAYVEGSSRSADGDKEDEVLFETAAGMALAGLRTHEGEPMVIIPVGPWRLYLVGQATLEDLTEAALAALAETRRRER